MKEREKEDAGRAENPPLEAACANPFALADPPLKVWFRGFADSSLDFDQRYEFRHLRQIQRARH